MVLKSELKARLLRGVGANGLGQIVTIITQVISVPLFLNYWGQELYGDWIILSATPMFISMSDLGFTSAAENEMTMMVAKRDKKQALQVFQSVWFLLILVSSLIVAIAFAIFNSIQITNYLSISQISSFESACIISCLSIYVLLGMQTRLLAGGFRCEGNYALGVHCTNSLRVLDYAVVIVAVFIGGKPLTIAICFAITRCLGNLWMYYFLSKKSPWIKYGFKDINYKVIQNLTKPAAACMGLPLINSLSNQGIILVIASALTSREIVLFSTLRTLSRLALQLMRTIRASIAPELSTAYALNNLDLARKLHRRSCQISLWLSLIAISGLIIFGDLIIKLWTKNKVQMDFTLFSILLVTVIFSSFWYTSFSVLTSTNQHHKIVPRYLFTTILFLCISIVIIPNFGINSTAICLMLVEVYMTFIVLKESLKLLEEKFTSYFHSLFDFKNIFLFIRNNI